MLDGIAIMERVHERGATIKALDRQFLDLSTTIGKGILAFLSALAQDERERILKRSKDGLKQPRRAGSAAAVHQRSTITSAKRLPGAWLRGRARVPLHGGRPRLQSISRR